MNISKWGRYYASNIYLSTEGTRWSVQCVEENIHREGETTFVIHIILMIAVFLSDNIITSIDVIWKFRGFGEGYPEQDY